MSGFSFGSPATTTAAATGFGAATFGTAQNR